MHRNLLPALLSLTILLSAFAAAKNPSYTFTTIDVPFPNAFETTATAINDRGQIVGGYEFRTSPGNVHGFLYDRGMFTTFDVPGFGNAAPQGINNQGQISGFFGIVVESMAFCMMRVPILRSMFLGPT